jgi:hypothetical protein
MARLPTPIWFFVVASLGIFAQSANAADPDGCAHFTWDVSHELTVMKQTPRAIAGATKPGPEAPLIELDKLYELKLSSQAAVTYPAKPAKPTLNDSAQGGLVRFHVDKAGLYRISVTSGHWIDVVDGEQLVKSRDFQGARGCERPHKIVEFDLSAGKDLILQFSGSTDPAVLMAITLVNTSAAT